MKRIVPSLLGLVALVVTGCITNDIPYPRVHVVFTAFAVDSETRPASIDTNNNVVTVYLPEEADPYHVQVTNYALSPDGAALKDPNALAAPLNLSEPVTVTTALYQDYAWTIQAVQDIERYFRVENQIGDAVIDPAARRVIATVSTASPLSAVRVTAAKLGAPGSTMTPDIAGKTVDFTHPVEVTVDQWGHPQTWTIYMRQSQATVITERVDAFTCVAYVYGQALEGRRNTVQYRLKGAADWVTVPAVWLSGEGGTFHALLRGLTPATTYEARAVSDEEYGAAVEFTTGYALQVPNASMDQWWLDGKVWQPWAEGGEPWWDTGNDGACTLGQSNSVPTDDTSTGHGQAAKLQTRFVGVAGLGKLAAGNLFSGVYVRTVGTNGVLSFGRPFTQRPTRLRGYYKYHSATINKATTEMKHMIGNPDTCRIYIAMLDCPEPYEIRTQPSDRQLFDPHGSYVVAYGEMQQAYDTQEYTQFDITLTYYDTSRVPRYILIVATASKWGDYFTGGDGSVLYVDEFELGYDMP